MAAPFRGTGCMERTKGAMGILSIEKNLQAFPSLRVATPFLFQTDVLLFQKKESLFFIESGPHHPMRVVSFFFKRNLCITFLVYHKVACTFLSKETFTCAAWISLFLLRRLHLAEDRWVYVVHIRAASCGLYLFNLKGISKVSWSPSYYESRCVRQGIFSNVSIQISCKIKISKSPEILN